MRGKTLRHGQPSIRASIPWAIMETDAEIFTLGRENLLDHFDRGHPVARKVVSHLARQVVRQLRLLNFRLREHVALKRGELDRAHTARVVL